MGLRKVFLENAWYAAALSSEVVKGEMFSRKLLGKKVMMFREASGKVIAMRDRCPHRFIPLSQGKLDEDNNVVCPYHGLVFNGEGQCVHNPHGKGNIPPGAKVETYTIEERYGFLWIWMGDQPADVSRLGDWAELDNGPATGVAHTYMKLDCNYELIIDNVMDLSHVDHVHSEIISTRGQLSPMIPKPKIEDNTVTTDWEWKQTPAMLIFNQFLPDPEAEARHYFQIVWSAPANIQLSVGATQEAEGWDNKVSQYDLHTATPADEYNTHYFFATRRDHIEDDAEYNEFKIKAMHGAFIDEDGPIVRAIQEEMEDEDFFDLKPVLLSNDASPVHVRRILQRLIENEKGAEASLSAAE